jgi:hypothetical protein
VETLPVASEGAGVRSQRALPVPAVENFGRRLAEAIGERDPGSKTRRRKGSEKRTAASTMTDSIAAAIAPDGGEGPAGAEPAASGRRAAQGRKTAATDEAGQPTSEKPKRTPRNRRPQLDAAAPPNRRQFWAAQAGDAQDSPPLALPPPQEPAPVEAPAPDAPMQPGQAVAHDKTPPSRGAQTVHAAELPSLARLEPAPDGQRLAPRPGTREQYEKEGFRYLAERMRLADNDSEPAEEPEAAAPTHDSRQSLPGPLVAFHGEAPQPPPRESNLLQRLAGLVRPRREA